MASPISGILGLMGSGEFEPWAEGGRTPHHWDVLDEHGDGLREYFRRCVPADGVLIGVDERTILVGRGEE